MVMQLYIGSEGEIDDFGELTEDGKRAVYGVSADAESVQQVLGARLILFSADQGAAFASARLIAEDIEADEHVASQFAESISRFPANVANMHGFIGTLLTRYEVPLDNAMVLFVSSEMLVRAVAGPLPIEGNVFDIPETWPNPYLIPEFAIDPNRADLRPW